MDEIPRLPELKAQSPRMTTLDAHEGNITPLKESPKPSDSKMPLPDSESEKVSFVSQKPSSTSMVEKTSRPNREKMTPIEFSAPKLQNLHSEKKSAITTPQLNAKASGDTKNSDPSKSNSPSLPMPDFEDSRINTPSMTVPDFEEGSSGSKGSMPSMASHPIDRLSTALESLLASSQESEASSSGYQPPFYTEAFHREHDHSPFFGRE